MKNGDWIWVDGPNGQPVNRFCPDVKIDGPFIGTCVAIRGYGSVVACMDQNGKIIGWAEKVWETESEKHDYFGRIWADDYRIASKLANNKLEEK